MCRIDLIRLGTPKVTSYDEIWNMAIRLVGQCPDFGGSGTIGRTRTWRMVVSSPVYGAVAGVGSEYDRKSDSSVTEKGVMGGLNRVQLVRR